METSNSANKPFTPFGIHFHQLLAQKIKLKYAPFFFCGKYAYEEAKASVEAGSLALCLPIGQNFDDYAWSITGLRLIVFDTGSMSSLGLSKLAYSILKHGAELVAVYSETKMSTDVFTFKLKKELQDGKGAGK